MKLLILTVLITLSFSLFAQITPNSQWTWMNGDSTVNKFGIYGLREIANPNNNPGARDYSSSWKDASGNLWLFGGNVSCPFYGTGLFDDLWKYDISNNQWIWMNGGSGPWQGGVYGTQGVPSPYNQPGSRELSISWTDNVGNLWLFGGHGFTTVSGQFYLDDLWKYDPSNNEWTWIKDSAANQLGVYGTKGVPNDTNKPGGREDGASWTDALGNLWIFGGWGYSASGSSYSSNTLNDLWKYDISTNQWTWISGDSTHNQWGIYGTKGISAASNKPGVRSSSSTWIDASGKFWLFGGYGYDAFGNQDFLNDLWKFDPLINQWTWINGDKTIDQVSVYGTKGVAATANSPGSRAWGRTWVDGSGNLWMFGGVTPSSNRVNDLWKYNPITNQWTWVKGDNSINQSGSYGILGTSASANKPGSRSAGLTWADALGNLWLFGGNGKGASTGSGNLNDLWKLDATSFVWIGITSTDWTVGSNWSGGVVPGPTNYIIIPYPTPYSATIPPTISVSCRSITIQPGALVNLGTDAHLNVTH
jgi:N-acetylneuraminic acid mutarotase